MIVLDLLFRICLSPFQKFEKGSIAAVLCLFQILGPIILAITNAVLFIVGINLSSIGLVIVGTIELFLLFKWLDHAYLRQDQKLRAMNFPFFMAILIFIFIIISLFTMVISLARY